MRLRALRLVARPRRALARLDVGQRAEDAGPPVLGRHRDRDRGNDADLRDAVPTRADRLPVRGGPGDDRWVVASSILGLATVYPNGVRTIAGLESASEGTVRIDSHDVTRTEPGKRGVAMVFQDYALFPHMTAAENITYPLKVRRAIAVFVTHDRAEALALADRIAVMQTGKLRQLGSPRELFARPANTFVANFIGSTPMNLLAGKALSGSDGSAGSVSVAGGSLPAATGSVPAAAELTVGVRPEYLVLSTGDVTGPSIRGELLARQPVTVA
jgi:hypothetical protein